METWSHFGTILVETRPCYSRFAENTHMVLVTPARTIKIPISSRRTPEKNTDQELPGASILGNRN